MSRQLVSSDDTPSMLLAFRGENVRSFRDEFELSLLATTLAEPDVVRHIHWRSGDGPKSEVGVLAAAALFGANASGKTNALRALADLRHAVLQSFSGWAPTGGARRVPYRLDAESASKPSRYEIDLVLAGVRHEYGFELNDEAVVSEWVYRYPHGRRQLMFDREGEHIKLGPAMSSSLATATQIVRTNALLLSTAAALRGNELVALYEWFRRNLRFADVESREGRQLHTTRMLEDPTRKAQVLALLRAADLGVVGAHNVEAPEEVRERSAQVVRILDDSGSVQADVLGSIRLEHQATDGTVSFSFEDESLGTQVWLGLVGPIIDALADGAVLIAEELDVSLHPHLVEQLVRLFQSPASNPRRAQLIFNSHDANLMGDSGPSRILGRDQIWFTEKKSDGSTRLYPLSDLNPRKGEAAGRRYLDGRYGAVPIVSGADFDAVSELIASP